MAAPTNDVQKLQKILANGGPSTHGLYHRLAVPQPTPLTSPRKIPCSASFDGASAAPRPYGPHMKAHL